MGSFYIMQINLPALQDSQCQIGEKYGREQVKTIPIWVQYDCKIIWFDMDRFLAARICA